jgi:signal transduction histidine kinase
MRRRYRKKFERLERQRLLAQERARIAQDLHDDLGAGLAEISFGSELTQDPSLSVEETREYTAEIGARAREMVSALDEIVWAVNPRHDTLPSLASYLCQFIQHFLTPAKVRWHLDVPHDLPSVPLNAEQRHNLFLAFKEALLNAVKHSGATEIKFGLCLENGAMVIVLADNGRGLPQSKANEANGGDGLANMRQRLGRLGGKCALASTATGTTVTFTVPLQAPVLSEATNL